MLTMQMFEGGNGRVGFEMDGGTAAIGEWRGGGGGEDLGEVAWVLVVEDGIGLGLPGKTAAKLVGLIYGYSKNKQVFDVQNNKEDILSRFLVESKKDPETMTDQYLRDIILSFIIAGKDTTANTLSWFIYVLCKNPLIQEKTAQEINKLVVSSQHEASSVNNFIESITDEALEEMHYLHATLTETLRLYPAVPVDGRCAETDDTLPDGFKLKKGDGVYYMAYAMGRMTHVWGDDAEEFKPERWINNGIFQSESPFKFVSFHGGPRTCLGKDFAYRQMKIVSAALVHFFRFRLSDETKDVTYRTMFTLHISGSLNIHAVPRTGFC
ncbi:cytochrome p450 704c1 [Phtheirospermum japonicum]|uniref:Cytochrome p450 704c1 n=1 Tax=Phtheirospermum japonicum TaxID=374723 RepID=A0A830B5E5_9LAMI|nr:cytochrome p450 704c1 [Phtheirospermum japonicum]